MITKQRTEIVALERERVVVRLVATLCPVCNFRTEMLTTRQAGALAQVRPQSIYRWLTQGKAHGVRTGGGQHRVCRNSLFSIQAV
jgi:hypothetical protein